MVEQKMITLGEVNVPIIVDDDVEYYPVSYISEKVLLRKGNNIINKSQLKEYADGIRKYKIKFGERNVQLTNCISKYYLIKRLQQTQSGRLDENQRRKQNILHKHLGIELISEKKNFVDYLPENEYKIYDRHTLNAILEFTERNVGIKYQLCSSCDKYYPLANKFFHIDDRTPTGYYKMCLVCEGKIKFFKREDVELNKVKKISDELYEAYNKNQVIPLYKAYLDGQLNFIPDCFSNKESYLKITKWLLDNNMISTEDLTVSNLMKIHKLKNINEFYSTNQIHYDLFGEDSLYYPWKYPQIQRGKLHSFDLAKIEFTNFIKEHNLKIDNPLKFSYGDIIHKAKIRLRDLLSFVVFYNDKEYAGYKFSIKSSNYYKDDDNILFDFKYLIEKDLKIEVDKIPLYITKNSLRINAASLYNFIVTKQNGSIYEWINKLYPEKFTPYDFDINYYRDSFDSIEESQIHEILVENLDNVIYNARNTKRSIKIQGMEPDWVVIGKDRCWFIEYFGLYMENGGYNQRVHNYVERTEIKINKYENELFYYGKIYLYPKDLKNNFTGVREKIKVIR